MKKGMTIFKVYQCVGCKTCEIACAVEHSQSKDLFCAPQEKPVPTSRIKIESKDGSPMAVTCRQCPGNPCVKSCQTGALSRSEPCSPVLYEPTLCDGCRKCIESCPFGAIRFAEEGGTIIKCDQCYERVQRGNLPACVESCPTRAMTFEDIEQALAEKRKVSLFKVEHTPAKEGAETVR